MSATPQKGSRRPRPTLPFKFGVFGRCDTKGSDQISLQHFRWKFSVAFKDKVSRVEGLFPDHPRRVSRASTTRCEFMVVA